MLKTSKSTKFTTKSRKGGVGVGGNGNGDGGNDSSHNNKYSPCSSGRAHQQTHQLVQPRLWSSITRLIEEGVVLLVSQSKSRRIVKKSEKPQRPEKLQRSLVWRNIYRSTNHPSIVYKKLELPLELLAVFRALLLGPEAFSIPRLEQLPTWQS